MKLEALDKDVQSIQEARVLARQGKVAADQMATYTEEQVDRILRNIVKRVTERTIELSQMAVEDTGFGNVADKVFKNYLAAQLNYNYIKDMKTIGVLEHDPVKKMYAVAEPVGLLMGITPSTNPTATVIYNSLIALKARDAIVFAPHPAAFRCTKLAAEIVARAAEEAGAPRNVVQCVETPTMEGTDELMRAKEVKMILATGGPGMVKAAYSSGKPALGVGAGNSPSYIERTADIAHAVRSIVDSKTFDYGTICASEQSIVTDRCIADQVIRELKTVGGYFMTPEETKAVCKLLFKPGTTTMAAKFVGKSAKHIADAAGIQIPEGTRVLIGKQDGVGPEYPLSFEKLTCVLGFYVVEDWHEACDLSYKLLQNGLGHSMSIHTNNQDIALAFSAKPASRINVNGGGSMLGTGMCSALAPSFTLGCGTCGGSATSENVNPTQLINVKHMVSAIRTVDDVLRNNPKLTEMLDQVKSGQCCKSSNAVALEDMMAKKGEEYITVGCCTGKEREPAINQISDAELRRIVHEIAKNMQ